MILTGTTRKFLVKTRLAGPFQPEQPGNISGLRFQFYQKIGRFWPQKTGNSYKRRSNFGLKTGNIWSRGRVQIITNV